MISLSELLKKVLTLYSANFRIILIALLATIIWDVIISAIPVSLQTSLRFGTLVFGISFIIASFTELALIKGYAYLIERKSFSLSDIFVPALKKLPWFILILILWTAIMTVGIIFLVIPAVIFGVWFLFTGTVLMLEETRGIRVFKRSKQLTSGFFFPLLWRVGLISFATFFVVIAASQGFASTLTYLLGQENFYGKLLSEIIGAILAALAMPIVSGTIVTLYFEVRRLKG